MRHFEKLFLVEEAWFLWDQVLDAEKDGDEFVPSETFVELSDDKHAKARIVRNLHGVPMMVLILRGYDEAHAEAVAKGFFDGEYELAFPAVSGDLCFTSKKMPGRLRPPVQDPGGHQ